MSDWDEVPENWGAGHYRENYPVCKLVRQARERQKRDLEASLNDPDFPYYYDDAAADDAVWFIEQLVQVEGEWRGHPLILEAWQEWDIVRPVFGWRKKSDGYRRFRTAYVEIPRRNGKTTLAAAICAYMLIADREARAQVYSGATKEDQARIVWEMCRDMLQASPTLRGEAQAFKSAIVNYELASSFKPLGRDSKAHDGFSVHGAVIDEYHAHKTPDVMNVLASGRGSRRQPLLFIITTAGIGTASPCRKEHNLAQRILSGILNNDEYFAYITTVDDPDKWEDPEEWKKANPNLGVSVYVDGFASEFKEAQQSADKQNEFKRKKLNIWTEQATRWIPMDAWSRCDGLIDREALRGARCFAGLDLGITRDISALALVFQVGKAIREETGEELPLIQLLMRYWCPEETLEQRYLTDGVNYPQWAAEGWLTPTPGASTRYDIIRRDINALQEEFEIAEVAIDRAHAHQLMVELADDGLTIVKHSQGFGAMNFPCRSLEEAVLETRLRHGNDPVMRWMMSNVAIARDAYENIRMVKDKSGDRIDGPVAAAMGIGRLLVAPEPEAFVYNTRGLYVG